MRRTYRAIKGGLGLALGRFTMNNSRRMNRTLICLGGLAAFAAFAQTPPAPSDARFHFREPKPTTYRVEQQNAAGGAAQGRSNWLRAWPENASRHPVQFGSRVPLQLKPRTDIQELLKGSSLKLSRPAAAN